VRLLGTERALLLTWTLTE